MVLRVDVNFKKFLKNLKNFKILKIVQKVEKGKNFENFKKFSVSKFFEKFFALKIIFDQQFLFLSPGRAVAPYGFSCYIKRAKR